MRRLNIGFFCLVALLIGASIGACSAQTLEIEQALREISLTTQVTIVATKYTFKNTGKQATQHVDICHLTEHTLKAAVFEVIEGDSDDGPALPLLAGTEAVDRVACFKAQLQQPLQPGKSLKLRAAASFTGLQTPFPAAIFQNEPQRMLFEENVYVLSPYKVLKQSTKIKLPSKNIESYTTASPVSLSQSMIKYGEYGPQEPFTLQELRLHYENNTPFAVATTLVREVEISHWGNVYLEERYTIKHVGAKIRGEWSRFELMQDPTRNGQTAVRGFLAHLPAGAHSIYFKDAIGNISSSQLRPGVQATEVILTPRYPLYGGWQAEFVLGYSLPLEDVVQRNRQTGDLTAIALFGCSLAGVIVDHIENRVVLPEGSTFKGVNTPFQVDQASDTKYTYLDTSGRPVIVISKRNIVFEHNVGFTVDYAFSSISLLREPLLLIAVYSLFFAFVILYCRCNLVLTRGASWEAEDRAERTAFLVEDITNIISERESQVLTASSGGGADAAGLLEKLRKSETKLNARCRDLEGLAGPKHSAVVRELLEKEKAVQSRISQLASKTQGSASGAGSTEAAQQGLKDMATSLKEDHAKKLDQLS